MCLFAACLITGGLMAQSHQDSTYIRNYDTDLQLLGHIRYNQSSISINGHQQGNLGFEQSGMAIGTRLQFNHFGLGISVPTRLFRAGRQGSSLGLQLQMFPKSLLIRAGAFRLRGFQETTADLKVLPNLPIRQNIRMWHFYLQPIYAFSGKRYSLRSMFQLTQRQLKSSGTFLAAYRLEYMWLNNTFNIPEQNVQPHVIDNYFLRQNAIELGYAHTFVICKKAFISAMAMGGMAHTRTNYLLAAEKFAFKAWQFVPVGNFTASMGYHSDRYIAAVRFNYRHRSIDSKDIQMQVNDWSVQLTCGVRLYAPRVKRQLDLRAARFARHFVPVRG